MFLLTKLLVLAEMISYASRSDSLFLYPYFHLWTHDRDSFHAVLEGKSTEYALIPENMDDTSTYKQISVGRSKSPWRRHLRKVVRKPLYLNLGGKFDSSTIEDDRL